MNAWDNPEREKMTKTNEAKLIEAFASGLQIDAASVVDELEYNSIPEWDSIAHMAMIAELESAFDIMLDTDDIINMSSVGKAKEILRNYGIDI